MVSALTPSLCEPLRAALPAVAVAAGGLPLLSRFAVLSFSLAPASARETACRGSAAPQRCGADAGKVAAKAAPVLGRSVAAFGGLGALAVPSLAGAGQRRCIAPAARYAGEIFQQAAVRFPSKYEEIASTNKVEKQADIICTIGPKSWDPEVLVKLMEAGMNVIRCNMSHGNHEEQSMKLANLEKAYEMRPEFRGKVKVLMDTRGPEIRTGTFEVYDSKEELKAGKSGQRIIVQDGPVVGEREIKDIAEWAVPNNADYIALSFVQCAEDVKECRKHCAGKPIKIISKIESVDGLKNFDEILAESDGIMVARGDLGMEIPMEKVFMAQKMMISKCKAAGKYVVTAEMLASMQHKPFPTYVEACNVANAILDGTSAVMLSSESAIGDFPVETVTTIRRIVEEAEVALAPALVSV